MKNYTLCASGVHWVKNVQIRSFFWSVFSCIRTPYSVISVFSADTGKYGLEKTLYLHTFHAMMSPLNTHTFRK